MAANITALNDKKIQRIFSALPDLPEDQQPEQKWSAELVPPPRTGDTVAQTFPAADELLPPESSPSGPLSVVNMQPQGEDFESAPDRIVVRFSEPMVPLSKRETVQARAFPIKVSPHVQGSWQWVGTETALFTPGNALPMATNFEIEVPEGMRSASGNALGEQVKWQFSTRALEVIQVHPTRGPQVHEPVVFLQFNQRINAQDVLSFIELRHQSQTFALRLATDEEVEADALVARLVENAPEASWIAIKPTQKLPAKSTITLRFREGAPSAEGPRTGDKVFKSTFMTYGPMTFSKAQCGWGRDDCRPGHNLRFEFSNPIDTSVDLSEFVEIEPELDGLNVSASYRELNIAGRTRPNTTYHVRVRAGLPDDYGQTLQTPAKATFEIGSGYPFVAKPRDFMIVADPAYSTRYAVYSREISSLDVAVYQVGIEDYEKYLSERERIERWQYDHDWNEKQFAPRMPGNLVHESTITIEGTDVHELRESIVDLSSAFNGQRLGHAIVVVKPTRDVVATFDDGYRNWLHMSWVQSTHLAMDAIAGTKKQLFRVSSLVDGGPVEGATISSGRMRESITTDASGLAEVDFDALSDENARWVVTKGGDSAFLPPSYSRFSRSNMRGGEATRWLVLDDRAIYRPGESGRLKGWIRIFDEGPQGQLRMLSNASEVSYVIREPRGNEIARGEAPINEFGAFDIAFDVPAEGVNLGQASVQLSVKASKGAANYRHYFQIQEFRRPEYEVSVNVEPGVYRVGDTAEAVAQATYYTGGPLSDAPVSWQVSKSRTHYTPPNHSDFVFGSELLPWWRFGNDNGRPEYASFEGRTDAMGQHRLELELDAPEVPSARLWNTTATVTDVNRQQWSSSANLLVHPSDHYVGLRREQYFVDVGTPLAVDAVVTTIEGERVDGSKVDVLAERLVWRQVSGEWKEVVEDPQTCAKTSSQDPISCAFNADEPGRYRITATIEDTQGRANRAQVYMWVAGERQIPSRNLEREDIVLIPDKQSYAPGDTARILVQAPFFPAHGVVIVQRQGIAHYEALELREASTTLEIPIEDAWLPNISVQVELTGASSRVNADGDVDESLPQRPAYASATLDLPLSIARKQLDVIVNPTAARETPGATTRVQIEVRDNLNQPVENAEVLFFAVDEAILSLTNYTLRSPLTAFYAHLRANVRTEYFRGHVVLVDPEALAQYEASSEDAAMESYEFSGMMGRGPQSAVMKRAMGASGEMDDGPMLAMRESFDALAVFIPTMKTDSNGQITAEFKLPDSLTRYRLMAVATKGADQFGTGESTLTVRQPLMVQPSLPRFLRHGDEAELPVVLHNQTDEEMTVQIAARGTNIQMTHAHGYAVRVPGNDRVEVRFPARATNTGQATVQIGAISGEWSDAVVVQLPVRLPAVPENAATYGVLDEQEVFVQPIDVPDAIHADYGGLEITTSSTQLQALTDAFIYLVNYPYECAEQITSRLLSIFALKDVLESFGAEGLPDEDTLDKQVRADIERLSKLQNHDGGFRFWPTHRESWPYTSIHASLALSRALSLGYDVPVEVFQQASEYIQTMDSRVAKLNHLSQRMRNTMIAYALFVRAQSDDVDIYSAQNALQSARQSNYKEHSIEALGWLMSVLAGNSESRALLSDVQRHLGNHVNETAATAHFDEYDRNYGYYTLHSKRRTDAVVLHALIDSTPDHYLIPKLVEGLLAHRKKGKWLNTQENVFVLLALRRYFDEYESTAPDFVARMWFGDQYGGEQVYQGYDTARRYLEVPMTSLVQSRKQSPESSDEFQNVILQKQGSGRLYYRVGMRYAPLETTVDPADFGFSVTRRYVAVEDENDVTQLADGSWRIKAGATVRIELTMTLPGRRYHVALVDPMPAGFEPINFALATTAPRPEDNVSSHPNRWFFWGPWYVHQNLRDERAEAFADILDNGVYTYSYYAIATTPGEFVAPPAHAEEMYYPETFGRSSIESVRIE